MHPHAKKLQTTRQELSEATRDAIQRRLDTPTRIMLATETDPVGQLVSRLMALEAWQQSCHGGAPSNVDHAQLMSQQLATLHQRVGALEQEVAALRTVVMGTRTESEHGVSSPLLQRAGPRTGVQWPVSCSDARRAGISLAEIRAAGYSCSEARAAGCAATMHRGANVRL